MRQYNPMSDQIARHTNIPSDLILSVSRKAEAVLCNLQTTRGSGTVGTNNRHVAELVDAGLITLAPSIEFGYSRATIVSIDDFKTVDEFKDQPDIVVHGPNSFKIRYPFDALNSWRELVFADYARHMKSHTN